MITSTLMASRTVRQGWTVLEILVVTAIFGLLLALLLPAVQRSREAARRTQCLSHLHQMGIAAHNYELTYQVFPGSALLGGGQWKEQMLPYLESMEGSSDGRYSPIYACPSDEFHERRVCYQVNDGLWPVDHNGFAMARPWEYVRAADITDGLSNTAAFSEKLAWPDIGGFDIPPESFPQYWIRRIRRTAAFVGDLDRFADVCRDTTLPPSRAWEIVWGYNHILTPNQNSCYNGPRTEPEANFYRAITATSQHVGGVHVLYADGRVQFTSDNIDREIWRAVGTRNGGEPISLGR